MRAAFRRVAESGFEGLRLRQVAEDVGIDHSTLHHYFVTKQDLIEAVTAYATSEFRTTAMPVGADPTTQLHHHLAALTRVLCERPELLTVSAELDLRARRDPAVRAVLDQHEAGWREALVALFDTGSWSDALRPEAAAETVIAAVKGVRLVPELAGEVFAQLEALLHPSPQS
ncbi:MAG: TetR/AcrR family transcriptional regulator [Sciscionella sp.]